MILIYKVAGVPPTTKKDNINFYFFLRHIPLQHNKI